MKMRFAVLATIVTALPLAAQSAAEHIALGNKEWTAGNAPASLKHYEAAIAAEPKNADALWRASTAAVDVGEFDPKRDSLYKVAEGYARRAVAEDPNSAMTHFALAKAVGRYAQTLGKTERVKFANVVHDEAVAALKIDSLNPGALHVLGVWNAEIMRLSGFSRFMAKNLLGGKTFGEANWDAAAKNLEKAAAVEPDRITHAVDLAEVYADRGEKDKARATFEKAISLKPADFNDKHYQERAQKGLAELK